MSTSTGSDTITRRHISAEAAQRVLAAAREKASEMGIPAAIAIVDADGTLKAFERMDGCALLPVRIAQQKAWTAISFGISTQEWWDMVSQDQPLLHGITHQQDVIVFAGGVPIKDGDEVIGGLGISGGHHSQDHEIAEAAAAAL